MGVKSLQEYPVNAGVPKGFILDSTFFLLYINDLPDDVICNTAIYADDNTLSLIRHLTCRLEPDLPDIACWGRKWLVDFNTEKTEVILFDRSSNSGAF